MTGSLQINHVAARYWNQIGQYHAGSDTTERDLARLVEYFGKSKLLTEISGTDVAQLVAWRRGQHVKSNSKKSEGGKNYILRHPCHRQPILHRSIENTFQFRQGRRCQV